MKQNYIQRYIYIRVSIYPDLMGATGTAYPSPARKGTLFVLYAQNLNYLVYSSVLVYHNNSRTMSILLLEVNRKYLLLLTIIIASLCTCFNRLYTTLSAVLYNCFLFNWCLFIFPSYWEHLMKLSEKETPLREILLRVGGNRHSMENKTTLLFCWKIGEHKVCLMPINTI